MSYGAQMMTVMRERERLIARCEAQRTELSVLAEQFEGPLKIADRAVAGFDYLRRHPLLVGIAAGLVLVVQRRNWWSWLRRGYVLWRAYRALDRTLTT
jgi:hypothetical protein